jgi:hypothetical protein
MIVSASYRSDIPAFYGRWFEARWRAGACRVVNPYGGPETSVALGPGAVEAVVFWTRNAAPFLAVLERIAADRVPFVLQHTILGYPRQLERAVPAAEEAVAVVHELRRRFGPRAVVWRYDPILFSSLTPPDWHRRQFARLAAALEGACDEVVASFVAPYRKTTRNLATLARRTGVTWRDPDVEEKKALLAELAPIAARHAMRLTLCTQPDLVSAAVPAARCIDAARLSALAGRPIAAREKGNRPGCLCHESRDIGRYDTCPHGCVYCYAVGSRTRAVAAHKHHDPTAEAL